MERRQKRTVGLITAATVALALLLVVGGWFPMANSDYSPAPSHVTSPSPTFEGEASPSESPVAASPSSSVPSTYLVEVSITGSPNGVIRSTPAGIECPRKCSARFAAGTIVTLEPLATEPPLGFETQFSGFTGGCSGLACTINVSQTTRVEGSFTDVVAMVSLTVVKNATSQGALFITTSPTDWTSGIVCGDICTASFPYGTVISLYVTVSVGSTFVGWSGPCSGTLECSFTLTAPTTATATALSDS